MKLFDIIDAVFGIVVLVLILNAIFDDNLTLSNLVTSMKIFIAMTIAGEYRLHKKTASLEEAICNLKKELEDARSEANREVKQLEDAKQLDIMKNKDEK